MDLSESILDLSFLSFIKFADGLENDYIYALKPLIVGKTNFVTGEFEVIICGQILTKKEFEELEDVFKKHGGKIGNFHKQEIKKRNEENSCQDKEYSKVQLILLQIDGNFFYEFNSAINKEAAINFLIKKDDLKDFNYQIVVTPEGFFGKDITGIYSE